MAKWRRFGLDLERGSDFAKITRYLRFLREYTRKASPLYMQNTHIYAARRVRSGNAPLFSRRSEKVQKKAPSTHYH
jgi:hypothetical protein